MLNNGQTEPKVFDQSPLTTDIQNALAIALELMPNCALRDKLAKLTDRIQDEKLDVRLVSRE